ncbi:transcriptional regulator, AsnC family [Exiguobacterium sibiricum 255-15]|uniref:Transcriptional regulator, AsnC family n=1 Tax=Exiguobacterium sibiricum (strain DSM 17290 / CCUG 55495 / CIP 109462 / JCM 13490 / 255-15) TaxID=262543 RepID=B1YGI0_EXIS2|nr:Lrp/AsnC family transcriptional regulator [Exiguobacterium sibiricum]ACB60984.1 transcriptional regulator, AsnC family [Exiguobacterium sibiricum 255-15]
MDEIDYAIIQTLQGDGRMSWTELGKTVGLSTPAVNERVKKLEYRGVIEGYRAVINPVALEKTIMAILMFEDTKCDAFIAFCQDHPDVIECHRLAGTFNFMVKLYTPSVETLETFIDASMKYGKPSTWIRLSSPVAFKAFTVGNGVLI